MEINAKELHAHLLKILKEFDSFCRDHNLEYYMIGGTALGAVRHKGFIPWDDDVDVAMKRDQYEKLISLSDRLPDNLEIFYQGTDKRAPSPYVKIIDKTTTLIEKFYPTIVEGLYIDVFPLDKVCKDEKKIKKLFNKIHFFFNLNKLHFSDRKKKGLKEIAHRIVKKINPDLFFHIMEKLAQQYNNSSDGDYYLANFLGAYGEKETYEPSVFGSPQLYYFEDVQLYGPERIDDYLRKTYGDYWKYPPKEEQVFRHSYVYLDLNHPFSEYKAK